MSLKKLANDAIEKANKSTTEEQLDNSKKEKEKRAVEYVAKKKAISAEFYKQLSNVCVQYYEITLASDEEICGHLICFANKVLSDKLQVKPEDAVKEAKNPEGNNEKVANAEAKNPEVENPKPEKS